VRATVFLCPLRNPLKAVANLHDGTLDLLRGLFQLLAHPAEERQVLGEFRFHVREFSGALPAMLGGRLDNGHSAGFGRL
jgi:hypothetical protein